MATTESINAQLEGELGLREFIDRKQFVEHRLAVRFAAASLVSFVMAMPADPSENTAYYVTNNATGSWALAGVFCAGVALASGVVCTYRYPRLLARYRESHPTANINELQQEWASPELMTHWESVQEVLASA